MTDLKLGKLPDRTPVKIAITVSPELHLALQQYAALYRTTYGEAESVAELIPFMLESFLDGDRAFAKARREQSLDLTPGTTPSRRRRSIPSSTQTQEE